MTYDFFFQPCVGGEYGEEGLEAAASHTPRHSAGLHLPDPSYGLAVHWPPPNCSGIVL